MATLDATVGGVGSNSYLSVARADELAALYPSQASRDAWLGLEQQDKIKHLIAATSILNKYVQFVGRLVSDDQALSWPRTEAYDKEGRLIEYNVIPLQVEQATIDTACWLAVNDGKSSAVSPAQYQSLRVGPIALEYSTKHPQRATEYFPADLQSTIGVLGVVNMTSGIQVVRLRRT